MEAARDTVRIRGDRIVKGIVHRRCTGCQKLKPLDDFGIRRMAGQGKNGADLLTNQAQCRSCR
jgi:hypothetical protein